MLAIPLVRALWAYPFFDFLEDRGARVDAYLEAAGLPNDIRAVPERPLPARELYRWIGALAREVDVADIGLEVGEKTDFSRHVGLGDVATTAPTLAAAIETAIQWMPTVHSSKRLSLTVAEAEAKLSTRNHGAPPEPSDDHFTLWLMIALLRMAAGPTWLPDVVSLESSASGTTGRICTRQGHIRKNAAVTSVRFPAELLHRPLPHGSTATRYQTRIRPKPLPTEMDVCLQSVVELLLPAGRADLYHVARTLGVSSRTLQRRLRAHGYCFSSLLERARFSLARKLLDNPSRKVIDVAFELGYSAHPHFTSAFHRWTGVSPRVFRQVHCQHEFTDDPEMALETTV